ncbi:MAG TPA: hypothetical protein DCG49_09390 [Ruminococcus sp.]|nr:hypothetical protein [Ruminococcus sp.]
MMRVKPIWNESRRRAGRTFLQTACGVLISGLLFAVLDADPHTNGLRLALSALLSALIAAGIAALMNMGKKNPRNRNLSSDCGIK